MLVILTSVDNVCLDYGTENERPLSSMTVAEAKKYMEQGQFGEGGYAAEDSGCDRLYR